MTYQLIYVSESSTPLQADDLEDILEHAQISNAEDGITGALVYFDRLFLQIIEGEQDAVGALMQRIVRDLRHETVTVLQESDISGRQFSDWNMAYVSATNEQVAQWAGLGSITRIPELLADFQKDSQRAARVADGILALLSADKQQQVALVRGRVS